MAVGMKRPLRYIPAGAWIRERYLPRTSDRRRKPRSEPEWNKLWHVATGDIQWRPQWWNGRALAHCGYDMTLDWNFDDGTPANEIVVVDDDPVVDTCRRCRRAIH